MILYYHVFAVMSTHFRGFVLKYFKEVLSWKYKLIEYVIFVKMQI